MLRLLLVLLPVIARDSVESDAFDTLRQRATAPAASWVLLEQREGISDALLKGSKKKPACGTPGGVFREKCAAKKFSEFQKDLFPSYAALQAGYYSYNGTVHSTLSDFARLRMMLERHKEILFGGGEKDGMEKEVARVSDAAKQINGVVISGVSRLWENAATLQKNAVEQIDKMKESLIAALETMTGKIEQAEKLQTQYSDARRKALVSRSQTILNVAAKNATSQIAQVSKTVVQTSETLTASGQQADKTITSKAQALDDADDLVTTAPDRVDETVGKVVEKVSTTVEKLTTDVETTADTKVKLTGQKTDSVDASLKKNTESQIDQSAQDWTNAATVKEHSVSGKIVNQTNAVVSGVAAISSQTDVKTQTVTQTHSAAKSTMAQGLDDSEDTVKLLAAFMDSLASGVDQSTNSFRNSFELQGDAAASSASGVKNELTRVLGASNGAVNAELAALVQNLGDVNGDTKSLSFQMQQSLGREAQTLHNQLGERGFGLANQLNTQQSMISSGSAGMQARVTANADKASALAQMSAKELMAALGDVAATMEDQAHSQSSLNQKIVGDKRAEMSKLLGQMSNVMKAEDAKYAKFETTEKSRTLADFMKTLSDVKLAGGSASNAQRAIEAVLQQQKNAQVSLDHSNSFAAKQLGDSATQLAEADERSVQHILQTLAAADTMVADSNQKTDTLVRSDFRSLWSQVQQGLADEETQRSKSTREAQATAGVSLQRLESASGSLGALISEVQSLYNKDALENDVKTELLKKLEESKSFSSQSIAKEQVALAQRNGQLDRWFRGVMGEKTRKYLAQVAAASDAQLRAANSAGAQGERLQGLINEIAKLQHEASLGNTDRFERMLTMLGNESRDMDLVNQEHVDKLRAAFEEFRHAAETRYNELTAEIQAEVAVIPGLLQGGASELSSSLNKADADVNQKINALKRKLAKAQTAEEKEEIEKGLAVLYRIQTVSEETRKAQQVQLQKIANNEDYDHREFGRLSGAMTQTVDAVKQMNNNIKAQKLGVKSQLEDVSKDVSDIFEELGQEIDVNKLKMRRALNESALESQFQITVLDTKNSRRFDQLNQTVASTYRLSNDHIQSLTEDQQKLHDYIVTGDADVETLSRDFVQRMDDVWKTLNASKAKMEALTGEGAAESTRRLRLVQGALMGFSSLWEEYASTMEGKLRSFRAGDSQFVEALQNQVKEKLLAMEGRVKSAVDANKRVNVSVEDLTKQEDIFEEFVVNKLLELANKQDHMNEARNELVTAARRSLFDFENHAKELDASLKQRVKDQLDVFAQRVTDKQNALDIN